VADAPRGCQVKARNYVAIARRYEDDVIAGAVPACKWTRLACERNRRDRGRARTKAFPYWFDKALANKRCRQAELFPHIKGPKAKIIGRDSQGRSRWATIELEPHQCWFLTTLFGWKRVGTHLRRFRIALYLVPRKNAKSTLAAIIALLMLADDGEGGAECYSAATTRDQAKAIAEIVHEMARRSPEFREYFGVKLGSETTRTLTVPATSGKFAPLAAEAQTLDGLNVHLACVDELHAHRNRGVWDVLDTATGGRAQPLILATTTAGVDIGGICYEKVQYLHAVLDGVFQDEQFFGVEYTLDEGDDWRDADAHRKANPNYGVSVDPEDLRRKVRAAEHSPAAVNNFLTKHCNVWVRSESTWMPLDAWRACGRAALRELVAGGTFAGVPCWIGIDLAETRDIMAKQMTFRVAPDAHPELHDSLVELLGLEAARVLYVTVGRYYLPEDTIAQSPVAQIAGWVRDGHIVQTSGNVADFERLEDDIVADCAAFDVQEICFDRALAAAIVQQLQRRLGEQPPIIVIKQSVDVMDPAMKCIERLVLGRELAHDANPAMDWMITNIVVERNYKDEIYPRKAGGKDSHNKIDGAIALFNTMARAFEPIESSISVYEERGLVVM
jgi:phage terminase large subunit-like protein